MNKHKKESTREPMSPDYLYDQEHARSADECLQALRHTYNDLIDELEAEREKVRILREAVTELLALDLCICPAGHTPCPICRGKTALAATGEGGSTK